jgi:hypothetical protein
LGSDVTVGSGDARVGQRLGVRVALGLAVLLAGSRAAAQAAAEDEPPLEAAEEVAQPGAAQGEAEPEPLESGDYTQPKAKRTCSTQDVLRGVCTSEEAAQASAQRIWRLMARVDFVAPVVFDSTPETEILAYYYAGAELDLPFAKGLYAVAWVGLMQRFWRVAGQSPVDFEDPLLGVGYRHSVRLGGDHSLVLIHRFGAYLPASRPSRDNLFYTTLDWITAARYPFEVRDVGNFVVGANVWTQFAFRRYETQTGELISADFDEPGGSNTVFKIEGAGLLQYSIFDAPSAGSMLAEASLGYRHRLRFDGSFEPDWYWALGATYTPISYFSASLAMEHGYSDLLRGGVTHLVAFDRDDTLWRVSLYGRY